MSFTWTSFLDKHGVEWVEGPSKNVAAGMIGINCPWCIPEDTGHHLGIHPERGSYSCWKDATHKGSKPTYLIQRIASCTKLQAEQIYEDLLFLGDVNLEALLEELDTPRKTSIIEPVEFTGHEFRLNPNSFASTPFYNYLQYKRDFTNPYKLAATYGLRGAVTGKYANRIIVPIYLDGVMIGWNARAISETTARYRTFPEGKHSIAGKVLYNYDNANQETRAVVLVEGPFDALKLDVVGATMGVRSVALMGLSLTDSKLLYLQKLSGKTKNLYLVLDKTALGQALEMKSKASSVIPNLKVLPFSEAKDPGAMTEKLARSFLERNIQ